MNSVYKSQFGSRGQTSFTHNAIKLWNSMPHQLKECQSKDTFKFKCKNYLMDSMAKQADQDFVYY